MLSASVIIPTCQRAGPLAKTLATLVKQEFPAADYEILVVDNGSTDNTRSIAEAAIQDYQQHRIRYLYEPVPGLLSGRHRGALEARADILVFVDDDIEATPGWLGAIIETFDDPTIQLVGGRNLPKYETEPPTWLEGFWKATPYGGRQCGCLSLLDLGSAPLEINAKYVWGLNFAIRRQALFDLGGFHPDCIPDDLQHFQGDGESGLTRKATERGYRAVYQPRAVVYHHIPTTRLTPQYFERRAFYQGVCDSYAEIRRYQAVPMSSSPNSRQAPEPISNRLRRFARYPLQRGYRFLCRSVTRAAKHVGLRSESDDEYTAVKGRFRRAYRAGYEFHRSAVRRDTTLLEWVLRPDYWDYRLPEGRCQVSGFR